VMLPRQVRLSAGHSGGIGGIIQYLPIQGVDAGVVFVAVPVVVPVVDGVVPVVVPVVDGVFPVVVDGVSLRQTGLGTPSTSCDVKWYPPGHVYCIVPRQVWLPTGHSGGIGGIMVPRQELRHAGVPVVDDAVSFSQIKIPPPSPVLVKTVKCDPVSQGSRVPVVLPVPGVDAGVVFVVVDGVLPVVVPVVDGVSLTQIYGPLLWYPAGQVPGNTCTSTPGVVPVPVVVVDGVVPVVVDGVFPVVVDGVLFTFIQSTPAK
jgi:hypothetical protein